MAENDYCKTKYPVLLIHGAGQVEDGIRFYWGRIPSLLRKRGARIFYGRHDRWSPTEFNARYLMGRLNRVLALTGAEKVNLIAHSKGGLEARMMASSLGGAEKIASVTTIGTPHAGSRALEIILRAPKPLWDLAGAVMDAFGRNTGDSAPDFCRVCRELTPESMEKFNRENPDAPGVFYQSFVTEMTSGRAEPLLALSYWFIRLAEGRNDGLVSMDSARRGERCFYLKTNDPRRGISHLRQIDFWRRPAARSDGKYVGDICDVYTAILHDLKRHGF